MALLDFSRQFLTLFRPWQELSVRLASVSQRTARNAVFTKCDHLHPGLTARKRAEVAAASQVEELRHSNAESQQFASIVSHDLQQPLFVTAGALELLVTHMQGTLDAKAEHLLDLARKGTQQLQTMLADLRTYVRVGAQGQPLTATDSATVWQQTVQTLQVHIAASQVTITADPLPLVRSDELRLALLFQNLLSNALKFRGPEPPRIQVSAQPREAAWVFAVQDNGIGIAPEHAERIFEVFQRVRTPREYPGTGIGLAICKRIVEQHGGRIWVESVPGKGAKFFFTLPAA
jgi:light-regulated signal transduction histidine kinase (bacteriophytochrome)